MATGDLTIDDALLNYIERVTLREPEILRRLREETSSHPYASMQVSPEQGQFMALGPALKTLDQLIAQGQGGRFDFAFIDADKENYANYYERALVLVRPGGLIAVDNVLWQGQVIDPSAKDGDTRAIRAFNESLHHDQRVWISMLPIRDGLTLACKKRS